MALEAARRSTFARPESTQVRRPRIAPSALSGNTLGGAPLTTARAVLLVSQVICTHYARISESFNDAFDQPLHSVLLTIQRTGKYANSTKSSSCATCAAGKYTNATGLSYCYSCVAGKYSDADASGCTSCARGQYSSTSTSATCTLCSPGKYTNHTSSTNCTTCATYHVQPSSGETSCYTCNAGYEGALNHTTCINCRAGHYKNATVSTQCRTSSCTFSVRTYHTHVRAQ
jgi:hypothetical protein